MTLSCIFLIITAVKALLEGTGSQLSKGFFSLKVWGGVFSLSSPGVAQESEFQ